MPAARTETTIPALDAHAMMGAFINHLREDHDVNFEDTPLGGKVVEQDGYRVEFEPSDAGLVVRLFGPNPHVLIFFKEEIAKHVAEIDPEAGAALRWSNETTSLGELPPNFKVLTVRSSRCVFDGLQRVTLTHEDIETLAADGLHVRLMLPLDESRPPVWPTMGQNGAPIWPSGDEALHARYVTLRHVRTECGEIDIDIALHQGGLISDWAAHARPGSQVGIMGPTGTSAMANSQGVFLAADLTGLSSVARLIAPFGTKSSGNIVLAAPESYNVKNYLPATGLDVHTVAPDLFEARVLAMAKELTSPGETTCAFFAGEFQNAQDLRQMFKLRLGLGKGHQLSVAYWRRGFPGFGG